MHYGSVSVCICECNLLLHTQIVRLTAMSCIFKSVIQTCNDGGNNRVIYLAIGKYSWPPMCLQVSHPIHKLKIFGSRARKFQNIYSKNPFKI